MLWSSWILPVEEWINWTDGIKGYYERQNSLSMSIQADETISCPLTGESFNRWHSKRKQDRRNMKIKCLKSKKQPTDVSKCSCNVTAALIQSPLSFCVKICQPLSLRQLSPALTPAQVKSLKGLCFLFSESVHRNHLAYILQSLIYSSLSELTREFH